ncbi:hypothetical protein CCACVL1_00236, partial [Corchorus capsularis]
QQTSTSVSSTNFTSHNMPQAPSSSEATPIVTKTSNKKTRSTTASVGKNVARASVNFS